VRPSVRGPADDAVASRLRALLGDSEPGDWPLRVTRSECPFRSTHALEDIEVHFPGGRCVPLVLKACGLAATRGVRPRIVMDGHRELWAYENLLPRLDVDAPRFLGVLDLDRSGQRLVLERVAGEPLHLVGDLGAWRAAARWLGRFHGRGRAAWERAAASGWLLAQDPSLHERWLARALRRAVGGAPSPGWTGSVARAARRAIRILAAAPRTLVHGEFYPSNVIVSRADSGWRARVVDWESIGVGPAALDLAALTTGGWSATARAGLIEAYRSAAPDPPTRGVGLDRELECATLINALQWLGWSEGWSAPPHQAWDWEAEARAAASRIATWAQV